MKRVNTMRGSKENELLGTKGQSIASEGWEAHRVGKHLVMVTDSGISQPGPSLVFHKDAYLLTVDPPRRKFHPFGPRSDFGEIPLVKGMTVTVELKHGERPARNGVASLVAWKKH